MEGWQGSQRGAWLSRVHDSRQKSRTGSPLSKAEYDDENGCLRRRSSQWAFKRTQNRFGGVQMLPATNTDAPT